MAHWTMTSLIVPGTCIITSVDIMPERENVLRNRHAQEEDGNMREWNNVGEAIAAPSTMDIEQSPSSYVPTTSITAMMI